MLTFARKQRLTPALHSVSDTVETLAPMLRRRLPGEITLATHVAPDTPSIMVDLRQLEQTLVNLVVNARDAMTHGGTISLHARRDVVLDGDGRAQQWAVLTVTDEGEGIPPEILSRIFEPYFTTKPAGRGTGLGLASVYGFVRGASGDVTVESTPQGSSFILRLPSAEHLRSMMETLRNLP